MKNEVAVRPDTSPVVIQDSATVMDVISRAASDPNTNIEKLERLMGMYERIESKKAEAAYNDAMSSAQSEMVRVSADATNPQTRSEYASYAALDRALRPIYTKHGFALSFDEGTTEKPEYVRVLCHVSHRGGFTRTYHRDMPADGKGAKGGDVMTKTHAAGAAQSYGMRYLLKGIFNVAIGEDDTDGNTVTERISEDQLANIEALMDEVKADREKFLKWARVENLADIPAKSYTNCVRMLEKKR